MKQYALTFCLICISISLHAQNLDTLIDVGGYKIHFNVISGYGTPILFEAGWGDDGSIWNNILKPISEVTNAPLITYDRSGIGSSEIDTTELDIKKHGIEKGMLALETGLKVLGYDKNIILVSHSFGFYYAKLYAVRHLYLVKHVVFIDAIHTWHTDEIITFVEEATTKECGSDGAGRHCAPGDRKGLRSASGRFQIRPRGIASTR